MIRQGLPAKHAKDAEGGIAIQRTRTIRIKIKVKIVITGERVHRTNMRRREP